jgi:hypothetical protein
MNASDPEHERIDRLFRRAYLPEPSAQVKDRVTKAARHAWDRASQDIPWRIPLRRLSLSAAAAVVVVALANHLGEVSGPRARPDDPRPASALNPEVEKLVKMVYGSVRGRLVTNGRRPSAVDGATLRDRMENIRAVLDEMEDDRIQAQPAPDGGRSRLPRNPRCLGSYASTQNRREVYNEKENRESPYGYRDRAGGLGRGLRHLGGHLGG